MWIREIRLETETLTFHPRYPCCKWLQTKRQHCLLERALLLSQRLFQKLIFIFWDPMLRTAVYASYLLIHLCLVLWFLVVHRGRCLHTCQVYNVQATAVVNSAQSGRLNPSLNAHGPSTCTARIRSWPNSLTFATACATMAFSLQRRQPFPSQDSSSTNNGPSASQTIIIIVLCIRDVLRPSH